MIKCNLAILLAERNLKITQVAKATNLSRTTLTYLANNYSQGIQLDTLNKLCLYLQVTPEQFFSYLPFEVKLSYCQCNNDPIMIKFHFLTRAKTEETFVYGVIDADFFTFPSEDDEDEMKTGATKLNVTIQLPSPGDTMDQHTEIETPCNNEILMKYFKQIPASFRKDIELEILSNISDIVSDIKIKNENCSLTWPNELL